MAKFVTQIIAYKRRLLGYYGKRNIAKDEKGLYSPGLKINVFNHPKLKFSLSVCADVDKKEIFKKYAEQSIFELAAPGLYGTQAVRDWQSGNSILYADIDVL